MNREYRDGELTDWGDEKFDVEVEVGEDDDFDPVLAHLWERVEAAGDARGLTDDELRKLHLWCYDHDIALPPAQWASEEAGRRELA